MAHDGSAAAHLAEVAQAEKVIAGSIEKAFGVAAGIEEGLMLEAA